MKTRRLFAVILTIAMLASFISIPAFAKSPGQITSDLGILAGTGTGVNESYLLQTATRQQAGLLVIRMMGLEEEALSFTGTSTFTDAAKSSAFWQPVLAYLKANPALGFGGYPDGSFNPTGTITGKEFTKALLTVMGYVQNVDYTWDEVLVFAEELGLNVLKNKGNLIVNDIATAIVQALGLTTTSGMSLISDLVATGVVTEQKAIAAGYTVERPELSIREAFASSVDKVTVKLNQPAPANSAVVLKRGTLGFNSTVTFSEDRTEITIKGFYNFPAGTYTVNVNTAEYSFSIESEKAVDFQIKAGSIFKTANQDLKVTLLNQYGEAMNLPANITYSVFNRTSSARQVTPSLDTKTIKVDATAANVGDEIFVFVYDPASQFSAQSIVVVNEVPVISGITLGEIVIKDNKASIFAPSNGHIIKVNAVDQYGKAMKITADMIGTTATDLIQLMSTNSAVVNANTITVNNDGNLVFNALASGTTRIAAFVPSKGIVVSVDVTVLAAPTLSSIEIAAPANSAVYAKEPVELQVVAKDQYGNVISFNNAGDPAITFSSSNNSIVDNANFNVTVKDKITVNAQKGGSATIFYYLGGVYKGSFSLTVLEEAVPTTITGIKFPTAYETGTELDITKSNIVVMDQYGREVKNLPEGWSIELTYNGIDNFTVELENGVYTLTTTAKAGTDTFNIYLNNNGRKEASVYSFTLANVAASEIVAFEMASIPVMYSGSARTSFGQAAGAYNEVIKITGKTADGRTVVLLENENGTPKIIDIFTSSSANLEISGTALIAKNDATGNVTIRAWRNGTVVASATITLSKDAPDVASITVDPATVKSTDYTNDNSDYFTFKDQYGRTLTMSSLTSANKIVTTVSNVDEADNKYTAIHSVIKSDGSVSASLSVTGYSK